MRNISKLIMVGTVAAVLLSGCNIKEKVTESITEGILEQASGGEVDVDINGDDISYSTEEGELSYDDSEGFSYEGEDGSIIASGGEYSWPEDQAAAYLPKLEKGTVTYIMNGADSCILMIDELAKEEYKDYEEDVISKGYTKDKYESSADDMEMYSGASEDGVVVTLYFSPSEGSLEVSVDATQKQ